MGIQVNEAKLKAMAAELSKDIIVRDTHRLNNNLAGASTSWSRFIQLIELELDAPAIAV